MAENSRIEEFRRRVQADPASIAFAALAEEFRRAGRYDDAIATCRTGLQRHPAYLSARVTLGRALIETGDYDGAREELQTVLRSAPENLAAIRGLAQIHERLGHASEMDPYLADMMQTMHAESIRAAVQPPPSAPVVPEAIPARQGEPDLRFQPEPQVEPDPQVEPGPQFHMDPQFQPEPHFPERQFEPEPQPQVEPYDTADPWGHLALPMEPELDLSLAPPLGVSPAPAPDLARILEPGPDRDQEPEHEIDAAAGPDPGMLATLARLERFLAAIQSLRA